MSRLVQFFNKLLRGTREVSEVPADPEELRAAFRARYHHFKLLLSANNKALEIMSEMEQALQGNHPFGMSFVRANAIAASVNVFRIVQNLDELASGKYQGLHARFREIEERINREISPRSPRLADQLIYPLRDVNRDMTDQVGSKMANLGELRNRVGIQVPNGFVVSSLAYQRFMEHNDLQTEIDRRLQATETEAIADLFSLSAGIQQLITRAPLPGDLAETIRRAYQALAAEEGRAVTVSMRSSALAEDSAGTSFAGQYRSMLNVSGDLILEAYREIIASKYSVPAMAYRLSRGIRDEEVSMCVGCMTMVHAAASGVMYSRNPIHIRDHSVHINSAWGLPKSVVEGIVTPDLFVVTREAGPAIARRDIQVKEQQFVCYPEEGVCRMEPTGDKRGVPSLADEQALALAEIAVRLENYYGSPQDIEWAVPSDNSISILQCRSLQQLEGTELEGDGQAAAGIGGEPLLLTGGTTASPGVACGAVFLLENAADMFRFAEGAVVVTSQPLPRWAALLSRAGAVVTERGSLTGHLASVAREFGVPALFGVADATRRLQEGQLITVDADSHRIYAGRVESLLAQPSLRRNLMEGSAVYETLRGVMQHVAPLNLIDPDSPHFRPEKCETLHDITRFAHEKSVDEMFSFGKGHRFPERSSKQLVCEVPMQWWVLNLDDGYAEEVEGKQVRIENIASIPMRAIWEGIIAVPWKGPPPVDTKGFLSVMVQATSNPALNESVRSPYENRNYFMISRHYCSLNSRFGFHFSAIESLVSDRAGENYVSFQFKGGAADYPRRVARAGFVAEILRQFGFRTEVKEDAVFARLEGETESFMCERLRILGYLIIHTRQLDMVMARSAAFQHYRDTIIADLEQLVGNRSSVPDSKARLM
jgi:pyruvate, water dikinase